MKLKFLIPIYLLAISLSAQTFSQLVNPFIGTGGHGHTFPGAVLPFGMVQLSPDTRIDGSWDGCGGYHYSDSVIYGFSHTHLSGTGVSDWGDVLLMPTIGEPSMDNKIYSSHFSHNKEKASAGYYEVMLEDDKIKTELTATYRTGIHRYSFPKTNKANLILDLLHRDKTLASNIRVIDSVTISGFRVSEAWAKEQHVYFIMKFSKPFKKMGYAINKTFRDTLSKRKREMAEGAYFQFDVSDEKPLMVKVGLSGADTDGGLKNLQAEASHWDFDKYKSQAEAEWNKELSKIEVKDTNKDKLTTFYTSLYHCMIHPSTNSDVDGRYRGRDNKIHEAKDYVHYNVFSLWDTYRALHPLFTIIDQKRTRDFIHTFFWNYDQARRLPVWELSSNETECMIGYHSVSVIADAFVKGIQDFDTVVIYNAMKAASNYTGFGQPAYINNGYLQVDDEPESVSKTLEYAYDDWCIAQMAQKFGKTEDYKHYLQRAQSYKNLFDNQTGFMRPRKNSNWLSPFDPSEVNNHYTEANSWQYSFYVPHDMDGLIRLHGGDAGFEKKLDDLFSASTKTTGREQADITGLIGQYAHGNEPSHHMAYLYNYVGKPQKTIALTQKILNEFYKNSPDGLIGNEDCGQMSAWYVFSSMGMYPVTPGFPMYTLSAPLFDDIKINLENGKSFVINTKDLNNGSNNKNVNGVMLNNKKIYRSSIPHALITNGGSLTFVYSNTSDSVVYGHKSMNRPHTRINAYPIVTVPVIKSQSKSFKNKQEISLSTNTPNANIVFTTDGIEPTRSSALYFKPFTIDTSCTIKAKIYLEKDSSKTTAAHFYKMPHNWKITLNCKYNRQYSAGGDEGIIDGIYGEINWRKGEWQGYQGQNFEATIDMGKEVTVTNIASNYLQDTRSWILFPTEIEYLVSDNGKKYTSAGKILNPVPASDYESQLKKFEYHLPKPVKARFVKIKAKNFGKLPEWHQGAGGEAFIFIDEIEVK
jgi:predicted alpha-1,2-mannosidase